MKLSQNLKQKKEKRTKNKKFIKIQFFDLFENTNVKVNLFHNQNQYNSYS